MIDRIISINEPLSEDEMKAVAHFNKENRKRIKTTASMTPEEIRKYWNYRNDLMGIYCTTSKHDL